MVGPFSTHRRKDIAFNMGKHEKEPLEKIRHEWDYHIKI
jgi:hypothetical protein